MKPCKNVKPNKKKWNKNENRVIILSATATPAVLSALSWYGGL